MLTLSSFPCPVPARITLGVIVEQLAGAPAGGCWADDRHVTHHSRRPLYQDRTSALTYLVEAGPGSRDSRQ